MKNVIQVKETEKNLNCNPKTDNKKWVLTDTKLTV